MRKTIRLGMGAGAVLGLVGLTAPAALADGFHGTPGAGWTGGGPGRGGGPHGGGAVFVQTDNQAGNAVVAYAVGPDGALTE
ncbi:MAG TPA: hypothetical protein VMB72_14065, partial [Acidimicrobiales bacterium]|nr:hypothetical protein [Acidimicrobiales bacterium]